MSKPIIHSFHSMNIALFCTTADTLPPTTDTIHAPLWLTYHLAEQLTKKGHSVTLYTIAGSKVHTQTITLPLTNWKKNTVAQTILEEGLVGTHRRMLFMNDQTALLEAYSHKQHDLIHAHTELALPLAALATTPTLVTYHSQQNSYYEKLFAYYKKNFSHIHFNALSRGHARQAKKVTFTDVVYNGIDLNQFTFNKKGGAYALFAGRLIKEKGPDDAIAVAQACNIQLQLIGSTFTAKGAPALFWGNKVRPHFSKNIQYKGMIPHTEIATYYQKAKVLLMPDKIEEAFGLVMVEAMACGTPVIAYNIGSIPEIVKHTVTGYIVRNKREMMSAVKKLYAMPSDAYEDMRRSCREHVEKNFSIDTMVTQYEKLYKKII